MQQKQVEVAVEVPDSLPALFGFVSRLEQVFVNLLNNARDAGATRIEVQGRATESKGRPAVRLVVGDNGPGIPPDILPKLFAQFVTTKPKGLGTGLGLRICRRIIEEMGGTIVATNRPEGGAQFEILVPQAGLLTTSSSDAISPATSP
jgi:signal transduction histidine kinase